MSEDEKYALDVSQGSGIESSGDQFSTVNIGDHFHGNVFKKLVAVHNGNLTFDPRMLRDLIVDIDSGIEAIEDNKFDFSPGIEMSVKNDINNHSKDFFKEFVEIDFYPQFYMVDEFSSLKENQKSLQKKLIVLLKA